MSDYAYIQNYSKKGTLGISRKVFEQIAYEATERVAGVKLDAKRQKSPFVLFRPIVIIIHKNGSVDIKIEVSIKKGNDVKVVCENIQKEVKYSLEQIVEQAKVNIVTKVTKIIN